MKKMRKRTELYIQVKDAIQARPSSPEFLTGEVLGRNVARRNRAGKEAIGYRARQSDCKP